ncbi:amidohydrolase [Pseudonocardia sp. 73-21]|uniref:amidohydrolase n=1 Tax=Pseudonocardia sp. 73-21 TaxID=1895809 RepID=UPI000967984B|nr:amidohydrolase [Pseudonocardia sp. 73-21]OJY42195.1 MAG: N-acyl-L-amino acid amidohydrolase [Pseudonocardia sp. 73-21]
MTLLDAHNDLLPPVEPVVADLGAGSGPAWLDAWLGTHRSDVVAWRRSLHSVPELARSEHRTTAMIKRHLMAAGLEPRTLPGGTGLVCDIGYGERCVALRADLDALPLQEDTGLPFASTVDGVSHACGHDAHTSILLGAALALASAPSLPGRVRLIFQPAEELQPGGALDMVADGAMEGVERAFALHCDPRLEVGKLGTRVGPITSACDVLEIRLTSPGGHTSRPHLTADLVEAMGLLITQLPLLLTRQVDPRSGTVLVWGAAHAGEAANAIPQHGLLRGTLRTADHATWNELEDKMRSLVAAVLAPLGVGYVLDHVRGVPPVVNEAVSAGMLADAAVAVLGPDASTSTEQSSGGEDFAWYLEHTDGAMARLGVWSGVGPMRDIHQPTFDLDERALPFGVRVMVNAALAALTH